MTRYQREGAKAWQCGKDEKLETARRARHAGRRRIRRSQ